MTKSDIPRIVGKISVRALQRNVTPVVSSMVVNFGRDAAGEFGVERFRTTPRVRQYFKSTKLTLKRVNTVTVNRIRIRLERAIEAERPTDAIAREIEGAFVQMTKGRALTIARTTVTQSSNFGTLEGYRQVGVEQKQWLTTSGGDARASHTDMDGQIRDINKPFRAPGGATADAPGQFGDPAEDVNCRCGVLPVVDERTYRSPSVVWKAFERRRQPYDRQLRRALSRAFRSQQRAVVAAIRAA